ncbi:MAG: GerMN domain-containing protein [Acidaminococcaceae bacterium]|nr:GerMN domain-containing protein [Acidaminococcaceae bacterium]
MLKKFAVLCTLLLCLLVVGCSEDQTAMVNPQPETKQTQSDKDKEITVTVYRAPANGEEYLLPEKVTRKMGTMTAPEVALDVLVNSSPQDTEKMVSLFPKGTKIMTMKLENGIAYVDFSKEITNVPQGSYTELMLTTAIVNTLTEFPEIKKVQILIEGKKIASLKGHTDILDPLERNITLLKK